MLELMRDSASAAVLLHMPNPATSASKPDCDAPLLQAIGIKKSFAGVSALSGVNMHLRRGEVLAVLGENGAGKSTLMKILAGVQTADAGELMVDGNACAFASTHEAMSRGIVLIHQELMLADNLDAASNVFLGREPRRWGFLQRQRMRREAQLWLDRLGFGLASDVAVAGLSPGKRQLIEIAKALATQARVLIMDEPTASLSHGETERLLALIRRLSADGVSVIYISHRLHEISAVADRVCVLRDGQTVGELKRDEVTHQAMVRLMVGRQLSEHFVRRQVVVRGDELLRVAALRTKAHPNQEVGLVVNRGEIVGIAGLVGAGRTELLRVIAGVDRAEAGRMELAGRPYAPPSPADAMQAGVALVPEDRKELGLVLNFSVCENVNLTTLDQSAFAGVWRRRSLELAKWQDYQSALSIKAASAQQSTRLLSGGNQQKIVIAKALACEPQILLLDEPTRGVDIGAKREIYELMNRFVAEGKCVLFASSDIEEIMGIADRVIVMHEGRVTGMLLRAELSQESIMALATGTSVNRES